MTTPNLKLDLIAADLRNWSQQANNNYKLIDATVGAYFSLQDLQGVWENSHVYELGQTVVDGDSITVWQCQVSHTSAMAPTTFAEDRAANATYWTVYSSPARARGTWTGPGTNYAVNDFIVNGTQYAVCIVSHTSTATFSSDVASGYWSILIDLSQVGSQVLPVLSGAADADKHVVTNSAGTGYTIVSSTTVLDMLGASTIGTSIFQAGSDSAVRTLINAQVSGSYQTTSTYLSAIASLTPAANSYTYFDASAVAVLGAITTFGRNLIDDANASAARTTLGLGTAATVNTGTTNGTVPVLNSSGELAAARIPDIDLTSMVTGVLPRANGGFDADEITASLGANVAMTVTGTYYTGPSIAQGTSGTWLVSGNVTVQNTGGGDIVNVKLWDGTTVVASTRMHLVSVSGTYYGVAHLSGKIASPAGDLRISVSPVGRGDGEIAYNASGNSKDSTITAFRIA